MLEAGRIDPVYCGVCKGPGAGYKKEKGPRDRRGRWLRNAVGCPYESMDFAFCGGGVTPSDAPPPKKKIKC